LIYELKVAGEPTALGVTGTHPFWSADRQAWVPVAELRIGEQLQARDGSWPRVESLTLCAEPEPVYNIEVEGDHCYRVGEQGLLVHNQSAPSSPTPALTGDCLNISSFSNDSSTPFMLGVSPVGHGLPQYAGGRVQGVLVVGSQQARLRSGQTNPGQWLQQSGFAAQSWYHVEGHAVSIMRQCCITQATLYINKKPCSDRPAYCQTTIPRALPSGSVLEVVFENDDHTTTGTGRFIGGVGWQEP
jgi:hypothetical protein